jgi:hypothetical protein
MLSAGDNLPVKVGVAVWARVGPGRAAGGRMVGTLRVWLTTLVEPEAAIRAYPRRVVRREE